MYKESTSGLQLLLNAASFVEKLEKKARSDAIRKQDTASENVLQENDDVKLSFKLNEVNSALLASEASFDVRSIPNHLITAYFSNDSDELRKRFRYQCTFSSTCSEVIESYGNESKAFVGMKEHLVYHHFMRDPIGEIEKRTKQDKNKNSLIKSRYFNLILQKRIVAEEATKELDEKLNDLKYLEEPRVASRDKSILQKSIIRNGKGNALVHLEPNFDANNFTDSPSIKYGQFEHDYSKKIDTNVSETRQVKNQQRKIDGYDKFDLTRHFKASECLAYSAPPIIHTPLFPYVYTPCPLEPAQVIELNSNGVPVNFRKSALFQSSTSKSLSKKAVENKLIRNKTKTFSLASIPRSVLECVENRVGSKSNASSEQKNVFLSDDSTENSENVKKSIHQIACKNIMILSQQRLKKKYCEKPLNYICEICEKEFTANTSLTYHYLGHLKIKPFKCLLCNRTFTRRHSLKYHMMIHDNTNRFQCPDCERRFRHPSHFKEHLRKHTGEEPFSCKYCSNKFKTRNSFKRHLKIQHQKLLTSNGIVPMNNDA